MKKAAKKNINAQITSVAGYHAGGWSSNISYAYLGFKANKYFTSDRFIKLDENFRRPDGKPLKGYGLEIETECWGLTNQTIYAEVLNKIIFPNFPDDLFKLQNDGSLDGDTSAELITQVMTKEFIRNNYAAFKVMYNTYFPAFNVSCVRTGSCGMHVNMSNALFGAKEETQATAIRKLLYIVNKHFKLFCALTNRPYDRTGYCARMHTFADKENAKTADLNHMANSHGVCFNGGHYREGRVELRIVGGQKDFGCFRNTMESIFHIVDAVKRLSWDDCDDVVKIFSGCNQYVFDRLKTKCFDAHAINIEQLAAIQQTVIREELI
jgi:hypothetical protein